jgi:hypothetical protein
MAKHPKKSAFITFKTVNGVGGSIPPPATTSIDPCLPENSAILSSLVRDSLSYCRFFQ